MAAATFTYKVRDKSGKVISGSIEGSSSAAVAKALRDRGFQPLGIEEQKKSTLKKEIKIPGLSGRVKVRDVSVFSRQFSTMINSGLSLLRSLSILAEQTTNSGLRTVILAVKSDVEGGMSLSQAMEKHSKVFSRLYVAMVKSGEVGGVLDETLNRLAKTLEDQVALRSKIRAAMMYPIAVMGLIVLIVSAMLVFVVPQFVGMYEDFGGDLPLPTKVLLILSDFVTEKWWLAIILVVGTIFGFRAWRNSPRGRDQWDALKLKLPVFGGLIHKTAIARFSHTLAALTRTGVPMLQLMDIVAETAGNAVVARAVRDVQASVKEGESLAAPLSGHKVFPPMVVQMMAVGEETGALDTMLEKVGSFYDREVETMVEGLTSLIEPLLIVFLGISVGGMLVALYMPMFKLFTLI